MTLRSASDGKLYTAYVDDATGLPPALALQQEIAGNRSFDRID